MLVYELPNRRQFVTAKPTGRRQRHRIQPVLRVTARMRHMDVWRFLILQTVEEESVAAYPQQGRHTNSLLLSHAGKEAVEVVKASEMLQGEVCDPAVDTISSK